jgi:hypothetical protein
LHARAEVGARGLHQQMEMTSHNDITQQLPAMADDRLFEPINQPTSVRIIADDFLPGIARRHHVINRAPKFKPKSLWDVGRLDAPSPPVLATPTDPEVDRCLELRWAPRWARFVSSDRRAQKDSDFEVTRAGTGALEDEPQLGSNPVAPTVAVALN